MARELRSRVLRLATRLQERGLSRAATDLRAMVEAASDAELWALIGDFGAPAGLLDRIEAGAVTDADRAALARFGLQGAVDSLDDFLAAVAAGAAEV